jgi:hypothetical protein
MVFEILAGTDGQDFTWILLFGGAESIRRTIFLSKNEVFSRSRRSGAAGFTAIFTVSSECCHVNIPGGFAK